MTMVAGFSEIIIADEKNYIRFEKFCLNLCERLESMPFVPTSLSWDQGRDGVSVGPARGSHAAVVCATLNDGLDAKVLLDLSRIKATTDPDRLVYCSSQDISEKRLDRIRADIKGTLGRASVTVLGRQQLASLAENHPDILQKHYAAELATIRANLLAFQEGCERTETKGLRLALIAFGSEDAVSLRKAVSRRAVLEALRTGGVSLNEVAIAAQLSSDLGLPRILNLQYIGSVLADLGEAGLATQKGGAWTITSSGIREAESIPAEAAQSLLAGRTVVRASLEELTGRALADERFEIVWSTLTDFLSELFYSNGIAIISAINSLVAGGAGEDGSDLEKLIEQGAARIGKIFAIPEMSAEYEQAVRDMFTERSGPAFDWLSRVCERFIALCALGLETTSAAEIRATLRRYQLVLDSDIVLTCLCEGEPDHRAIREVLGRFRSAGGRVLASQFVLEEVAYHAHISDRHFSQTSYLMGKLSVQDICRYTDNAFVRAFHVLSREPRKWPVYRQQFAGATARDYTKILRILQDELMVQLLPSAHDPELAKTISKYLQTLVQTPGEIETQHYTTDIGKPGRDGQILSSIAHARTAAKGAASSSSIVLLSSSTRLRRADRKFRRELGEPDAVISLRALSYLLSLVPNVELGAGSMRQALFNFGQTGHLTDVERFALRIIKATGEFDLPWARRCTLEHELDKVISAEAYRRDVSAPTLRKQVATGDRAAAADQLIVTAVRNMALKDKTAAELAEAQQQIRRLEKRLAQMEQLMLEGMSPQDER
ncbi:MAG: hypothetical protein KIT09_00340 [Bryobacteraceae bacterium]|nr:hypothetical protein [Bryobacteraceae bacterium]